MGIKKVADGECMSSMADSLGFRDYHSIYDDGANSGLKSKRPNPNALVVDDSVTTPDTKTKVEKKHSGKVWTFVVKKRHPIKLRLVIIDKKDKAISGLKWELTSPVAKSGTTAGDGLIEVPIPATAVAGGLKLHIKAPVEPKAHTPAPPKPGAKAVYPPVIKPDDFKDPVPKPLKDEDVEWKLKIGSLPSPNVLAGVQERLHNLGYRAVAENPAGPKTTAAVKAFQKKYHMTETGNYSDVESSVTKQHDNL